jgi:hypothetical protein
MAVTVSGLFVTTWTDVLDTSQLALDLDLDTHKVALFTNSITPNFSTDTAYGSAPYNANEIANGGGYTTGGTVLVGTALSESPTGTIMWDATDTSWASSTISLARCCLIYNDPVAADRAICLVDFDADYSTSNGTFAIQWASGGIFTWDLTP